MAYAPVQETLAPLVGGTPDEVERYRKLAEALMASSQSGEPVEHWMEGVGRLAQALSGTLTERKANKIQREGEARGWKYAEERLASQGGGYGGGEYADVPGAEAVSGNDAATMQYAGEAPSSGSAAIYQGMLKRGMNPAQAAAFAASVQQESGGNPNANNPGEGARGIIQWRADRLNNLQNFAARQGKPWNDVNTQMDFALWEMQNTEPGPGQMFRAAQTPEEANRALKAYIRYGDKAGPAGPAGWDSSKRLASTRRILDTFGGAAPAAPAGETADIPGAEPVGSAPSPDVAEFLQPPAQPPPSLADRQALIAKALGGPTENPADVAADVRKYYANKPPPPPRPPQPVGETAGIPGTEPIGFAPSPDVMAHITGRQPTPAGISIQPTPTITGAPPPAGAGTVPMPPVAAAPVAAPVARVPQPRPAPPVAAAPVAPVAPAVTGSVAPAAPVAPRPVYAPPVKNDYATVPGRRPSVAPVRPGQLMNEPYPGVMSAQEFARQGQAAMRARAAGQQPAMAPAAGQPPQPRRNLLQALLGRGGRQGPASPPAAPGASVAPAGGAAAPSRARLAAAMRDIAFLPPAAQAMALKRLFPEPGEGYTLSPGQVRYGPDGQPMAAVPGAPEKGTDDQREYQQAVSQGYTGSFVDYMREMKKAGATTINTGTPEAGDAALRKKLGEQEGERWSKLKQAGLTSGSMAQDIAVLDQLIEIAPQGPLTGRLAQMFPGVSDAGAAFQSIIQRVAPSLRVEGSGATSDIEFAGMLASMPGLQNRPEANRAIAGVFKAKAALNIERSDIITAYESGEIDASTARTQLAAVDRKSIMTPEMDQLLKGVSGTEPEAGPARPASKAEYDALPSGTEYVAPDGTTRRKP